MKLQLNIPEGYEIDKQISTFENIVLKKVESPMQKVYTYHGTTEEEFDKKYKNVSDWLKAQEQEALIVEFYNKGKKPDWDNSNQYKYYPWFYLGSNFRLDDVAYYYSGSDCSARLCFLNESDAKEATKEFIEVYRRSRNA